MTASTRPEVHNVYKAARRGPGHGHTGAVLATAVWGPVGGQKSPKGHWKKCVDYMYKYAVFDIKLAYNH